MSADLRARALRLLARREHTRQELAAKLGPHAESAEQINSLLDDLSASSLLSDERYAAMRIESRAARLGNSRVVYELRRKGVAQTVVSSAMACAEDELGRARRVWQKKFADRPRGDDDTAEFARQARFLAGRGFSADTIRRLLRANPDDE